MHTLNTEAARPGETTAIVFPIAGNIIDEMMRRGLLCWQDDEIVIVDGSLWDKDDLGALFVAIDDGRREESCGLVAVSAGTGIDHEKTALIDEAARSMVFDMPTIPGFSIMNRLSRYFGLTGEDAMAAIREAKRIAASALQKAAVVARRAR